DRDALRVLRVRVHRGRDVVRGARPAHARLARDPRGQLAGGSDNGRLLLAAASEPQRSTVGRVYWRSLTPSSSLAQDATLSRSRSRVRIPPGSPFQLWRRRRTGARAYEPREAIAAPLALLEGLARQPL